MNYIIQEDIEQIISEKLPWEKLFGKTVVITGATGMLASYLVYTLFEWNRRLESNKLKIVLAVRNIEKACKKFNEYLQLPELEIVEWEGSELKYEKKVDYIIHAASTADSSLYMKFPVETFRPNILGTYHLLELARRNKAEGFLFFSSASAYGKVEGKNYIDENDSGYINPNDVRSCYGESKRMGENMCADFAHEYQVPAYSVRISHTYGPTMDLEKDSRVFAEFVKNVVNNQNIVMKSDGSAKRAFCYISDAVIAFFTVLLKGTPGEMYNMCNSECFVSIRELAEILAGLFPEKKLKVVYQKRMEGDSYSENKNANLVINCNAKLKKLGWDPRVPIENGFSRTIKSFLEEKVN